MIKKYGTGQITGTESVPDDLLITKTATADWATGDESELATESGGE